MAAPQPDRDQWGLQHGWGLLQPGFSLTRLLCFSINVMLALKPVEKSIFTVKARVHSVATGLNPH